MPARSSETLLITRVLDAVRLAPMPMPQTVSTSTCASTLPSRSSR